MKSQIVFSLVTATLWSSYALAHDVRIDITGELVSSTCQIDPGGSPQTKTVTLPTLSTKSLEFAGAWAGRTPIIMTVSGCTADETSATMHFEAGGANVTESGALANLSTVDAAENVEVQILNATATVLNMHSDQAVYDIANGTGEIKLYAQYYSSAGGATAGTVSSYIEISMNYN